MRIIGVDFGERRTGIAVSDPMGWTAQGLEAVTGDSGKAAERTAQLAKEYGAKTIIIGNPLNMNGSEGFRARRTDDFIAELKKSIGDDTVEIKKWDERLTSKEAERTLRETGAKASTRSPRDKGRLDIISAAILLQSYLDSGKQ